MKIKVTLECEVEAYRGFVNTYTTGIDKEIVVSLKINSKYFGRVRNKWVGFHPLRGCEMKKITSLEFLILTGKTIEQVFCEIWENECTSRTSFDIHNGSVVLGVE